MSPQWMVNQIIHPDERRTERRERIRVGEKGPAHIFQSEERDRFGVRRQVAQASCPVDPIGDRKGVHEDDAGSV